MSTFCSDDTSDMNLIFNAVFEFLILYEQNEMSIEKYGTNTSCSPFLLLFDHRVSVIYVLYYNFQIAQLNELMLSEILEDAKTHPSMKERSF